jgi:cytochrome c556
MRSLKLATGFVLAASFGGLALAESHIDPALMAAHDARVAHMKAYGAQMMILGGMAQDKVAYDATAAAAAATALDALTHEDMSMMWPEGSDSDSVEGSRALPVIWTSLDDVMLKVGTLQEATTQLASVAGTDLDSLKAAFGAVGGACGACHEAYRKPQ